MQAHFRTLGLIFVGVFICNQIHAQSPKRIDFVKEGSNALVWEQSVAAKASKVFVFSGKKGQKVTIGFIDDTNIGTFSLDKKPLTANTEPTEIALVNTKDYFIMVTNNSKKTTSFRISIVLEEGKAGSK